MKKLMTLLALSGALSLSIAQTAAPAAPETQGATAQQNKMKTCNKEAGEKALKGDERKKFMSECLSAKTAGAGSQQNKMKTCNKEAGEKALKGDERKKFMSTCLSA